jgi:hypothetical protein
MWVATCATAALAAIYTWLALGAASSANQLGVWGVSLFAWIIAVLSSISALGSGRMTSRKQGDTTQTGLG